MALPEAIRFLKINDLFIILGHIEPDGDCIASQLVLTRFLKRIKKQAYCYSLGPFDRPEITKFESFFRKNIPEHILKKHPAVIVMDCSTSERIGKIYAQIKDLPILLIDHHVLGHRFGEVRLVNSEVPSTTLLVLKIIESFNYKPIRSEAQLLLFGLCTDSGYFRHFTNHSENAFRDVAKLVSAGANPKKVYNMIYGNSTLMQRKLLSKLLSRAESLVQGKIIFTHYTLKDKRESGNIFRSFDEMYRLLQAIAGTEVIVFIQQEAEYLYSVSLRSQNRVDVSKIAQSLGGGGHKLASGFSASGTIEEIKNAVLRAIKRVL